MIDIFIDGSSTQQNLEFPIGGIGIFFPKYKKLNYYEPFYLYPVTNQRCEFYACIKALQIVINYFIKYKKPQKKILIRFITDSKYLIDSMTKWINIWKQNKWKKIDNTLPKNFDFIYFLYNLSKQYENKLSILYKHVKSHEKSPSNKQSEEYYYWYGNYMVDKLAKKGKKESYNIN